MWPEVCWAARGRRACGAAPEASVGAAVRDADARVRFIRGSERERRTIVPVFCPFFAKLGRFWPKKSISRGFDANARETWHCLIGRLILSLSFSLL